MHIHVWLCVCVCVRVYTYVYIYRKVLWLTAASKPEILCFVFGTSIFKYYTKTSTKNPIKKRRIWKKKFEAENANIRTKHKLDLTNLGKVKRITPHITSILTKNDIKKLIYNFYPRTQKLIDLIENLKFLRSNLN